MLYFKSVLFVALVGLVQVSQCLKFPSTFKRCPVSAALDDKPNECLKGAIEDAIRQLSEAGNSDLGVNDLDPLDVENIYIEKGESSPVAIKLEFKNNKLRGVSNAHIKSAEGKLSSPKDFELKIIAVGEEVSIIGPYKISGKVLILPIQGEGTSNLTMMNPKITLTIKGEPQIKNGKEYLKIKSCNLDINPERLYMRFENLYKGDKALGENTNLFLNDNWKDIYGELKSSIDGAFSAIFEGYAKRIMERIQYKNIFIIE